MIAFQHDLYIDNSPLITWLASPSLLASQLTYHYTFCKVAHISPHCEDSTICFGNVRDGSPLFFLAQLRIS